jgi:Zn-dependent peptidase ImmA (M78 family)
VKFYRNQEIEDLAAERLSQLARILARPLAPPIPIDLLAEQILGLDFLWEDIDELPRETVLGALHPHKRLIIMNERHRALFDTKPGLERFTKGHEMGHWDLFIEQGALEHPTLFALDDTSPFTRRRSPVGEVTVMKWLLSFPGGQEFLRDLKARADDPNEARAVNRYAAAILMPKDLLRAEVDTIDRTRWSNLYRIAERFEVTIGALTVRLQQLRLLHVGMDRGLHESPAQAHGQLILPW